MGVAVEDAGVDAVEDLGRYCRPDRRADLFRRGPDVRQVDRLPVAVGAQRLRREVDVDRARQRERDDERRRGEVGGTRQRMDAPLEVAVARQDRRDDQLVALDRLGDRLVERSAVADARRAAVADYAKAQRLERLEQPGEFAGTRSPPASPGRAKS